MRKLTPHRLSSFDIHPLLQGAHTTGSLLGDVESGTLRLANEERGLFYEVDLPDTTAGRDCYELVRSGRIRHSSMGFQAFQDEFRRDGSILVRHLVSIRLTEVSPTAQPAYADTTTAIRSLANQVGEDPEDVLELARQGELRTLFSDRHPVMVDVGAGATEHRSDEAALRELEALRKLNEERAKRYGLDSTVDPLLDLYARRNRNRARREAPVSETCTLWYRPVS
jgi:uncharacterized protein